MPGDPFADPTAPSTAMNSAALQQQLAAARRSREEAVSYDSSGQSSRKPIRHGSHARLKNPVYIAPAHNDLVDHINRFRDVHSNVGPIINPPSFDDVWDRFNGKRRK
jgi:hypothetical protein